MVPIFSASIFSSWIQSLEQLIETWPYQPIFYFDWDKFLNLIETEPLTLIATAIGILNLLVIISFKVSDYWRDHHQEKSKKPKLMIAYDPHLSTPDNPVVTFTNLGHQSIVVKSIGIQYPWWQGGQFKIFDSETFHHVLTPHSDQSKNIYANHANPHLELPWVIDSKRFYKLPLTDALEEQLGAPGARIACVDTLGNIWKA